MGFIAAVEVDFSDAYVKSRREEIFHLPKSRQCLTVFYSQFIHSTIAFVNDLGNYDYWSLSSWYGYHNLCSQLSFLQAMKAKRMIDHGLQKYLSIQYFHEVVP